MNAVIAEAKELLSNATFADGFATCLTQDCEALKSAIDQAASAPAAESINAELLALLERAHGIRNPNSGKWTKAETALSWAEWDIQARAAIAKAAE